MATRAELEAALERAEADWRKAVEELGKAQASQAKASADWDKVVSERRKADTDRRKPGAVFNNAFPERRKPDTDRRSASAEVEALSRAVAERHKSYVDRNAAEEAWAAAQAKLKSAAAKRNAAIMALKELD